MTIVRELVTLLRYQVDQSGLRQYAQQARSVGQQVSGVGRAAMAGLRQGTREALAAYGLVPGQILRGIREQRRLNREQRQSARNVREIGGGYSAIGGYVRAALAALGTFQSARMIDEWAGVEARVGLVTDGINEQRHALEQLFSLSQAAGQDYLSTGELFAVVQRNRRELGLQLDQSLQLTDTIGKLLTIGGGSASGQQAALIQLSQALGSGVLRGEELNSILEQAPRLAQAIADGFGVSVGQLRALGADGKLLSKELVEGLLAQAESLNEEFEQMPKTFGRGMTIMRNAYGRFINELNKASRASERFYAISELIAENMAEIVKIGAFTALTAALTKLRPVAMAALAPFLRMAALLAGIYLVGEDLFVWSQGGHSLFGRWFGEYSEWQGTINSAKETLESIKSALGDSSQELSGWLMKWGAISLAAYAVFRLVSSIGKGLWVLLAPVARIGVFLVRWVAIPLVSLLAAIIGWPAVVALAMASIVSLFIAYFDEISNYLNGVWDRVVGYFKDKWAAAIDWVGSQLKKVLPKGWVLSGEEGQRAREEHGKRLNPYSGRMGALQRPQSYSSTQTNQITNETHIHAQTNNPSALANAAGQAVGRATNSAIRQRWAPPTVAPRVRLVVASVFE